jgi:YidC/Oxa1 family membrane protein insertase
VNLDFIAYPLGQFLYFIYNSMAFHNYGFAIIIFTVIIKLVLLPLTVKQYKSTAKMQEIQPEIQELQKKYKNDKETLNQELMLLYQKHKINPAGGCLPLLVQLPILFSLYWVIMQPLKFMLKIPVDKIYGKFNESKVLIENGLMQILNITERHGAEIHIIKNFDAGKASQLLSPDLVERIKDIGRGFHFLGIDLSQRATYNPSLLFGPEKWTYLPLLLFPIIGVITTYISSKMSMPPSNQTQKGDSQTAGMTNSMMYVGPIMTLIFSFQLPAGVVLYWISGYVFQIFQQLYINKYVMKRKEVEAK